MIFETTPPVNFDAQRERRHIKQQLILNRPRKNARLHGRAQRHHFIRIQLGMRTRAKQHLDRTTHQRNARRTAHQHYFVNLFGCKARIFHAIAAGAQRAVHDIADQVFKQLPGNLSPILALPRHANSMRAVGANEIALFGANHILPKRLHGFARMRNVLAPFRLNVFERNADQPVVDIIAAKMRVAVRCEDFENAIVQLQDRDIEGAAAEIIDGYDSLFALIEAVGERCRGGFVHQPQILRAPAMRPASRVAWALRVVEAWRAPVMTAFVTGPPSAIFGILLQLAKNESRDLGWRERLLCPSSTRITCFAAFGDAEREELQLILHIGHAATHQLRLHRNKCFGRDSR